LFLTPAIRLMSDFKRSLQRRGCYFSDRFNHASLVMECAFPCEFFRFRHNDVRHLETLLEKERGKFKELLLLLNLFLAWTETGAFERVGAFKKEI